MPTPHCPFPVIVFFCLVLPLLAADQFMRKSDGSFVLGNITINPVKRDISFPAAFAINKGPLEVIVAKPNGRLHEALCVADISALNLQAALLLLKAHNGVRTAAKPGAPQGTIVDIDVLWKDDNGTQRRSHIENWIRDNRTRKPMVRIGWVFVGSAVKNGAFLADAEGNIVINWSQGSTILDSPDPAAGSDTLHSVNPDTAFPQKYKDITIVLIPRR